MPQIAVKSLHWSMRPGATERDYIASAKSSVSEKHLPTLVQGRTGSTPAYRPPQASSCAKRLGTTSCVRCLPSACLCQLASRDRKSTRLNSSHVASTYAVCCLTKKIKWMGYRVYE